MPKARKLSSRPRLLAAGLKVFSERGYKSATVREICEEADSNISSIKYYFGDKIGFYRAVREHVRESHLHAMHRCWALVDSDPWQAVKVHIEILLSQTYDRTMAQINWFRMWELLESPHPEAIFTPDQSQEGKRRDYEEKITRLLSSLLGAAASETNIALVRYTYYSLCLFLPIQTHVEQRIFKTKGRFSVANTHDHTFLTEFIFNIVKRTVADMQNNITVEK